MPVPVTSISLSLCRGGRYSKNARYVPGGDFSSNVPSGGLGGGFQSSQVSGGGGGGYPGGFQVPSGAHVSGGGKGNAFSSGAPSSQSRFGRLAQFGMNSQAAQQPAGGGGEASAAHLQHFQRQQQFSGQANTAAEKPAASGFGRHKY